MMDETQAHIYTAKRTVLFVSNMGSEYYERAHSFNTSSFLADVQRGGGGREGKPHDLHNAKNVTHANLHRDNTIEDYTYTHL